MTVNNLPVFTHKYIFKKEILNKRRMNPMRIIKTKDYEEMSRKAANIIVYSSKFTVFTSEKSRSPASYFATRFL